MNTFARLLLIPAMALTVTSCSEPLTPEQQLAKKCEDRTMASIMTEDFVRKRLRSPASAEFPNSWGSDMLYIYLGDCTHSFTSYVDSQNGFGAMLRTYYSAQVQVDPKTDIYTLKELVIE